MTTIDSYIFWGSMIDKYERLIQEAKNEEMRRFCIEQWAYYNERFKTYFN